ncbi:RING finger protein 166 isoform X1 [Vombatus ursinus]|uniref:RING finger protein 166 isoform X1 n=1 Tax=Vombatus ursinus TaxID=29139 RepID=UPI000FFD972F|nr:RING finger protein 166 isoform X1 [Vombatus ursinus]
MAMFRSLVASAQQRQHPPAGAPASAPQPPAGPGAGGESGLEAQYSCPICLEVYHRPVAIGSCGHTFCGECLQPCLQVPSPLCPLCRMPFDPKKVDKASNVEKQLSSYKAPCRGCSKKVTLAKMRSHISSCMKVQEQMANCPKFVPVVPTSQPIPSNIPNRSTFVCPYCGARNLDQQELVKHCMENHRNDPNRVVCPICSAMPWGDPSYKSANFLQHLLHRHKFSYDTFVGSEDVIGSSCSSQAGGLCRHSSRHTWYILLGSRSSSSSCWRHTGMIGICRSLPRCKSHHSRRTTTSTKRLHFRPPWHCPFLRTEGSPGWARIQIWGQKSPFPHGGTRGLLILQHSLAVRPPCHLYLNCTFFNKVESLFLAQGEQANPRGQSSVPSLG